MSWVFCDRADFKYPVSTFLQVHLCLSGLNFKFPRIRLNCVTVNYLKAEFMYYSRRKDKTCVSKTIMRCSTIGQLLEDKGQKERLLRFHHGEICIQSSSDFQPQS